MERSFAIAAVVAVMLLTGCGTHAHSAGLSRSQITAALQGSPPRLASLHAKADRLISGGPKALNALLLSLRGYPIVINEWASGLADQGVIMARTARYRLTNDVARCACASAIKVSIDSPDPCSGKASR